MKRVNLVLICLLAAASYSSALAFTLNCQSASRNYYWPALNAMNAVNKWSGGTSFNRDALIEACQRVVYAKPYLVGVRCENSSLFNSQMNDLIKNCESQLEIYKSFVKPEPGQAAPAPAAPSSAEPAARDIGVKD